MVKHHFIVTATAERLKPFFTMVLYHKLFSDISYNKLQIMSLLLHPINIFHLAVEQLLDCL